MWTGLFSWTYSLLVHCLLANCCQSHMVLLQSERGLWPKDTYFLWIYTGLRHENRVCCLRQRKKFNDFNSKFILIHERPNHQVTSDPQCFPCFIQLNEYIVHTTSLLCSTCIPFFKSLSLMRKVALLGKCIF